MWYQDGHHKFGKDTVLYVKLPHDDINVYNKNEPLKLSANIVWQKQELGNSFIGVNFKDMNVQQQKGIKSCLDFFNNSI